MDLDRTGEETTTKNVLGLSTAGELVSDLPTDLSSSLRMWVPPLRLLSASIWQVVQQRQVQSYNRVEEFVSVVLELVPDLLSTEEKIELLLGLRTTFALDSCYRAPFITVKMMLSHLDRVSRIAEIASSDGDMSQTVEAAVKEFKELIQGLANCPAYRKRFFQETYPLRYGPSYDAALQLLMWEFLSRLEVLLPVPSFHQAASLFDEDPLLLEEFLQMGDDLQPIQELLLHKEHFTCLLSGSSPPPKTNTVLSTLSDSPILQAVLTASEQPDKCLSAPSEPHSFQNRPDLFGVPIDEDCSADVKEEDPDLMESNGLSSSPYIVGPSDASQHDQQGDTGHSSQTLNGLSSAPYIVVDWRGDDDDDDDDEGDDIDDDGHSQQDLDEGPSDTNQHDQQGDAGQSNQTSNGGTSSPYIVVNWSGDDDDGDDDDDDDDYGEGDSQPDWDEGASGTSQHDQQRDMQRTSQRTLNEERQIEIDDCRIDCERMVNDRSEESEPPSTEGSQLSTQQATHACPHCDKTFRFKDGLAKHINIHTGNRPFECSSCRKKFFRVSVLVDHLIRHTDCMTDCERMINDWSEDKDPTSTEPSRLSRLQSILRKAHKAPKYPCSSCGKVFLRPSGLAEHQKIHARGKPYVRSHCGESFQLKDSLTRHASTHKGERPFECSSCGKKFIRHSELVHHLKLHTDVDKPLNSHTEENHVAANADPNNKIADEPLYPCSKCGTNFSRNDLMIHQATNIDCSIDCERMVNDKSEESESPSTEGSLPSTQRHACPHCDKTFCFKDGLAKHINIHTGNRPFECSSCRKKFFRVSVLVDHLIRHTDCMTDCERMINDWSEDKDPPSTEPSRLSTLQDILRKAHKAPKYPCSSCGKVFLRPSGLAQHQKIHTRGKPYMRSHCDKRPHACPHCDKTFQQKAWLAKHINIHTGNRQFECSSCRKKFLRQSTLVDHLVGHTDCMTDCERMINDQSEDKDPPSTEPSRLSTLQAILRKAHKAPKHSCSTCGKFFLRPSVLAEHQKIHTGEKPHPCSYCGRKFRTKDILQLHIRTHTGYRPHKCSVCEKSFSQQSQLITHTRIHTGEKPYLCSFCGKTFNNVGGLNCHIRTHTGERSYQCEFCNKTFSNSGTLNIHRMVHTKEKPFLCTLCPKRFPTSGKLKNHMRTHTGEKPYSCLKCGKTFSEKGNLKVHQRVHR